MMLRCGSCKTPVLLLTPEQEARVEADPERYRFTCTDCLTGRPPNTYVDALDG